eukprot:IDg6503t1
MGWLSGVVAETEACLGLRLGAWDDYDCFHIFPKSHSKREAKLPLKYGNTEGTPERFSTLALIQFSPEALIAPQYCKSGA